MTDEEFFRQQQQRTTFHHDIGVCILTICIGIIVLGGLILFILGA